MYSPSHEKSDRVIYLMLARANNPKHSNNNTGNSRMRMLREE